MVAGATPQKPTLTWRPPMRSHSSTSSLAPSRSRCELGSFLPHVGHASDHVEGGFGDVVAIAGQHLLEIADCCLQVHKRAWSSSENLRHEERLRQETLHLAGTRHGELVLFTEFVHAQDGDNVLQR